MKNKKIIIISISAILLGLASIISYQAIKSSKVSTIDPEKAIVSRYKDGEVTLKEAQIELNKLALKNPNLQGLEFKNLNADQKELVIKDVVLREIAYKEAKIRGLDQTDQYKESFKLFELEILKQILYENIVNKATTEEKLREEYQRLAANLKDKLEVKVRFISVASKLEADAIYKQLNKKPKLFPALAKSKSLDKDTASRGGDLGFVLKEQLQPEIIAVINKLKKGQISKPIQIDDKWIIVKFEKKRKAKIAKFDEVKNALSQNLSKKALQKHISEGLKKAEISILVQ